MHVLISSCYSRMTFIFPLATIVTFLALLNSAEAFIRCRRFYHSSRTCPSFACSFNIYSKINPFSIITTNINRSPATIHLHILLIFYSYQYSYSNYFASSTTLIPEVVFFSCSLHFLVFMVPVLLYSVYKMHINTELYDS